MVSLLRAEVRRLTSRRLARVLAGLAVLVILIVEARAFAVSNKDVEGARRRAEREAGQFHGPDDRTLSDICHDMQDHRDAPPGIDCDSAEGVEFARSRVSFGGSADDYFHDPRLQGRQALPDGARAVAVAVAILGFVVGASFIGAEWHVGTMQALLFWETRRRRVLLAKALALVGVVMAFALVLQAFVYSLTFVTAATRGTLDGVTAGLNTSILLTVARGLVVVSVSALLGFGIAGLARVTAAALGVAFGYFVILENLVRGLRPGWQPYLVSENVSAVLLKRMQLILTPSAEPSFDGQGQVFRPHYLTGQRGAVTLAIYLAILLGAFYASFERRDVT